MTTPNLSSTSHLVLNTQLNTSIKLDNPYEVMMNCSAIRDYWLAKTINKLLDSNIKVLIQTPRIIIVGENNDFNPSWGKWMDKRFTAPGWKSMVDVQGAEAEDTGSGPVGWCEHCKQYGHAILECEDAEFDMNDGEYDNHDPYEYDKVGNFLW